MDGSKKWLWILISPPTCPHKNIHQVLHDNQMWRWIHCLGTPTLRLPQWIHYSPQFSSHYGYLFWRWSHLYLRILWHWWDWRWCWWRLTNVQAIPGSKTWLPCPCNRWGFLDIQFPELEAVWRVPTSSTPNSSSTSPFCVVSSLEGHCSKRSTSCPFHHQSSGTEGRNCKQQWPQLHWCRAWEWIQGDAPIGMLLCDTTHQLWGGGRWRPQVLMANHWACGLGKREVVCILKPWRSLVCIRLHPIL